MSCSKDFPDKSTMGIISPKLSRCSSKPQLQCEETTNILQAAIKKKDEGEERDTFFHAVRASIPQEVIIEILSWLPVKSLLTLKCVCKQWYALIQDRHFIEKHVSRSTPHFSYQLFRKIYFYGEHKLIHGRDSLSLEANYRTRNYCIRNRATRQKLYLPDACKDPLSMTLSYIRSTSEYKLVSISMNYERWEVLTVGEDKSWRPFLSNLQGCNLKSKRPKVVSAGSAVHCIRIIEICSKFAAEVVSFDLESETFTSIVLPHELFPDGKKVQALDWNGFLSFAEISQENLNVMVLEDYKKLKWDKGNIVIPLTFIKDSFDSVEDLVPLVARSGILSFWLTDEKIIGYDLETMKIRWICAASSWYTIFPPFYSMPPTLVALKGMQPDRGP